MISKSITDISVNEIALLNALIYYDLFNHPLTYSELRRSPVMRSLSQEELDLALSELQKKDWVKQKDGYFFIGKKAWTVDARLAERPRVESFMKKAQRSARIIASFPFVRGVAISGALSKHRVEENGDIDFFIITEPGMLWISRTLLVLFKKVFLLNSFKYFCLNYFIDTKTMEAPNKSLYTATDIVTLLPVYNLELYHRYLEINQWATRYYPDFPPRKPPFRVKPWSKTLKAGLEFLFRNSLGKKLDTWLMKRTLEYRQNKFSMVSEKKFRKAFITYKNISTHHPNDFQDVVMERFFKRQKDFEKEHSATLFDEPDKETYLNPQLV